MSKLPTWAVQASCQRVQTAGTTMNSARLLSTPTQSSTWSSRSDDSVAIGDPSPADGSAGDDGSSSACSAPGSGNVNLRRFVRVGPASTTASSRSAALGLGARRRRDGRGAGVSSSISGRVGPMGAEPDYDQSSRHLPQWTRRTARASVVVRRTRAATVPRHQERLGTLNFHCFLKPLFFFFRQ